jgi:MFS family permease
VNRVTLYFTFLVVLSADTIMKAGQVVLSLYALKLGAQPFAVGVIAATYSVLPMVLVWQTGKFADRFGARWIIVAGSVCGACGMMVPYYQPALFAIYIATALSSLMHAFADVSFQTLIGLLSTPHSRSRNFSNLTLVSSIAGFLGPMLAGFSIDLSGHAAACLSLACLTLAPITLLAVWGGRLPKGGGARHQTGGSAREMLATAGLWRMLITSSLVITGINLFQFYIPIYGNGIGLSASAIGIVLSMYSVSAFIVRLILPSVTARSSEEAVLTYSFFIGAASLTMVPFFTSVPVLALISLVFGLGMGCSQPMTMMMTCNIAPKGRTGEAMGLRLTANHVTRVVVPLIFGLIGSAFGTYPVFFVNALLLGAGGIVTKSSPSDRKDGRRETS